MAVSIDKDHPEGRNPGRKSDEPALAQVQAQADKEAELGFRGIEADPTPNENYTVAGVTSAAPTPETDKAHAKTVREHLLDVETRAEGVAKND